MRLASVKIENFTRCEVIWLPLRSAVYLVLTEACSLVEGREEEEPREPSEPQQGVVRMFGWACATHEYASRISNTGVGSCDWTGGRPTRRCWRQRAELGHD